MKPPGGPGGKTSASRVPAVRSWNFKSTLGLNALMGMKRTGLITRPTHIFIDVAFDVSFSFRALVLELFWSAVQNSTHALKLNKMAGNSFVFSLSTSKSCFGWVLAEIIFRIMPSQAGSSNSSDLASRYSHLLQPIRDLTKNWDIDVAAQLEEYLAEVRFLNRIHKKTAF